MIRSILIATALASPAFSQAPPCADRADVLDLLQSKYGEIQQSEGMAPNGVMELFANPGTGTWTMALTMPDGVMCLVASGEQFHAIPQGVAG